MTEKLPPEGFEPHFRRSLFTDPWEPLYSRVEPRHVSIGTWLRDVHCNSRGLVHGGFFSTLADNAMGLTCVAGLRDDGREVKGLVTINLNVDFVGLAKLGQWLNVESTIVKLTRQIGFASCNVCADGEVIARANASFKIA